MIELILTQVLIWATVVIALGLLFTHFYTGHFLKGLHFWVYGIIFESTGFLIIAFYENGIYKLIANILIYLGVICFYHGTNRFLDKKTQWKELLIVGVIIVILLPTFIYAYPSVELRRLTMSLTISFVLTRYTLLIYKNLKTDKGKYLHLHIPFSIGIIGIMFVRVIMIFFSINNLPIYNEITVDNILVGFVSLFVIIIASAMTTTTNLLAIRDLRNERRLLENLSNIDFLTQIPNRRSLYEHMKKLISENKSFKVIISDMDDFKMINDKFGHKIGDLVLIEYAKRLMSVKEHQDFIARFGGDEFIFIVESRYSNDVFEKNVRIKQKLIDNTIIINHQEIKIRTSFGISSYPEDGKTIDELIRKADEALYMVKLQGKDNYAFFKDIEHQIGN